MREVDMGLKQHDTQPHTCHVCGEQIGDDERCYVFASTDPDFPSQSWHVRCVNADRPLVSRPEAT